LGIQLEIERSVRLDGAEETRSGVHVTGVLPGGAADRAGIRAGDVVETINGMVLSETALMEFMGRLHAGDSVEFALRGAQGRRSVWAVADPDPRPANRPLAIERTVTIDGDVSALRGRGSNVTASSSRGVTILLRSGANTDESFTYQMQSLDPDAGLPFEAFVVRTPETDSLTALIFEVRERLGNVVAQTSPERVVLSRRLAALQSALAASSRAELRLPRNLPRDVRVRVSPRVPLSPLTDERRLFFLGAELSSVNPELGAYFGVEGGVLITSAQAETPAYEIGLRPGDVITAVRGSPVNDVSDLHDEVRAGTANATLTVVRSGGTVRLRVR